MLTDRRSFLASALAVAACQDSRAFGSTGANILRPEEFGAEGDGVTDDTQALQRCLDAAPAGAIVQLRSGAIYRVDSTDQPSAGGFGGLKLKSGQVLRLNSATLQALPSREGRGSVVHAFGVSGWRLEGPGRITGERSSHIGTSGEWGMGLSVWSSNDWSVGAGVEINDCWGDGLYVGSAHDRGPCDNFVIDQVHVWNCRRNGISIISGRNGEIRAPYIHDINGTNPQGGIDLEPDSPAHPNRNIRIKGGKIRNVAVGIYVTVANEDVLITGMDIEGGNSGIIVGDNTTNLRIEGNPRIKSLVGGEEGGAIRTVANPTTVRGLHIRNNELSGGGGFVLDIIGSEYRDLIVSGNRIYASNAGTQGIARIGAGVFSDNICVIGPRSGKKGDYFLFLQSVSRGRNVYRNQSPHEMYSAIRGGREAAPDRFEGPNLIRYSEPL